MDAVDDLKHSGVVEQAQKRREILGRIRRQKSVVGQKYLVARNGYQHHLVVAQKVYSIMLGCIFLGQTVHVAFHRRLVGAVNLRSLEVLLKVHVHEHGLVVVLVRVFILVAGGGRNHRRCCENEDKNKPVHYD